MEHSIWRRFHNVLGCWKRLLPPGFVSFLFRQILFAKDLDQVMEKIRSKKLEPVCDCKKDCVRWVCFLCTCEWGEFDFYSTPSRGRVYKWKFCPFVCLSSLLILFLQTLSSGESRNLSHGIQCPHPCLPCRLPPIPQSTGPPMNRIISQTFSSLIWFIISAVNIFQG